MITLLIALFGLGFALDITWTLTVQMVARQHPVRAALAQIGHTGLALSATWLVIDNESIPGAIAYVVGCCIGTYLVVRFGRRLR